MESLFFYLLIWNMELLITKCFNVNSAWEMKDEVFCTPG